MIVRCIDATLQRDVLTEGREYEVREIRHDLYFLSGFGKGFTKARFEVLPDSRLLDVVGADQR